MSPRPDQTKSLFEFSEELGLSREELAACLGIASRTTLYKKQNDTKYLLSLRRAWTYLDKNSKSQVAKEIAAKKPTSVDALCRIIFHRELAQKSIRGEHKPSHH